MDSRLPERFWNKVDVQQSGCWLWTGERSKAGYGRIFWQRKKHGAHRVAYTELVGPIPADREIDHTCNVRNCVNPAHLRTVTHKENMIRIRKPHCKQGHEMAGYNLRLSSDGQRHCRECNREAQAAFRTRARLADEERQGQEQRLARDVAAVLHG